MLRRRSDAGVASGGRADGFGRWNKVLKHPAQDTCHVTLSEGQQQLARTLLVAGVTVQAPQSGLAAQR